MELWIRSQDRTHMELVTWLMVNKNAKLEWYIEGGEILGYYKTKERALQVLDEIQNILQPIVYMKVPSIIVNPKDMIEDLTNNICLHTTQQVETELKQVGQFVYQMPKE